MTIVTFTEFPGDFGYPDNKYCYNRKYLEQQPSISYIEKTFWKQLLKMLETYTGKLLFLCPVVFIAMFIDSIAGFLLGSQCTIKKGTKFIKLVMIIAAMLLLLKIVIDMIKGGK